MNVGYEDFNTTDVAQLLGVSHQTVTYWCRQGYIKYQDVSSPGSDRPRYKFDEDEVNRVAKLIDKYGKKEWTLHNNIARQSENNAEPIKEPSPIAELGSEITIDPVNLEDTESIAMYIGKIRHLKSQRDKLLKELDSLDNAIKEMRQKVIEAI